MDRNVNEAFKFNQETEMIPILGMAANALSGTPKDGQVSASAVGPDNHHPALLSLLADELSVAPECIADFELSLYDTQPSTLGGA